MTTVRRRVLRPSPTPIAADSRQTARRQRRRAELAKSQAALRRWLTRLRRAANTVSDLHQRISRLQAALAEDS